MKTRNYTKEYLLKKINNLTKEIFQCKCAIGTCHTCIEKEKAKLNNTKVEHDELWLWRDKLNHNIFLMKTYKKQLKEFQKLYTQKYNYQPRKTYIFGVFF